MRPKTCLATAILVLSAAAATGASAQSGCRQRNGLGSDNVSRGINAAQPSRANTNPCSSLYDNGVNVRRMEKRKYPNAIVRH